MKKRGRKPVKSGGEFSRAVREKLRQVQRFSKRKRN